MAQLLCWWAPTKAAVAGELAFTTEGMKPNVASELATFVLSGRY